MKIVCINNSDILQGTIELLTINKTYEVLKTSQGQYYIKDNSGEERWYNDNRFKDISTIRKEKLKQLGI
jgi:hypothetical protein